MSQEGLGKAIGLDQQYISKLERGKVTGITVDTLGRLADVLKVSADHLLGRTKKKDDDSELFPAASALVGAER
jgi:transcriptional regulator with XRE-family HTH domain